MHVGKFRCLVRVTAHRPLDVSQLCARREECFPPASPGRGSFLFSDLLRVRYMVRRATVEPLGKQPKCFETLHSGVILV